MLWIEFEGLEGRDGKNASRVEGVDQSACSNGICYFTLPMYFRRQRYV